MAVERPAALADAAAVAAIYAHHVLHGFGTFEEVPPSQAEMASRVSAVQAAGHPWLVIEDGGEVAGYAYASQFRPRSGYRFAVEDSVYVAPKAQGRGHGRRLLQAVIDTCAAQGRRQMTAAVGDSANLASIRLHQALGFETVGVLPGLGFKQGRWLDVVFLQRALGPPAA
jgi:phosphinothricin acetyltransferase